MSNPEYVDDSPRLRCSSFLQFQSSVLRRIRTTHRTRCDLYTQTSQPLITSSLRLMANKYCIQSNHYTLAPYVKMAACRCNPSFYVHSNHPWSTTTVDTWSVVCLVRNTCLISVSKDRGGSLRQKNYCPPRWSLSAVRYRVLWIFFLITSHIATSCACWYGLFAENGQHDQASCFVFVLTLDIMSR